MFKYLERKLDEYKGEEEDRKTGESQTSKDESTVTLKEDDDESMKDQGKLDNATKYTPDENGEGAKTEEAGSSKTDTGSPKANGSKAIDDQTLEKHDRSQANKSIEPDGSEKSGRPDGKFEEKDPLDKGKKGGRKVEEMPSGDDQIKDIDGAKRIRLQN